MSKLRLNQKNQVHLLSKTTIALLFIVAGLAIYFLTPTSNSLEEKIASGQSPEVSLVYLNELEKVHPDDPMIPYLKAKIYYDKGRYNDVMEILAPAVVENSRNRTADTYILYIKTKIALAGSIDNESRKETLDKVRAEIKAFSVKDLTDEQLFELSDISLSVGLADSAYDFLKRVKIQNSGHQKRMYALAVRSGNFREASKYLYDIFIEEQSLENAEALFSLYLQSTDPSLFKDFVSEYKGKLIDDPEFLKKEINTANRLGLYDLSLSFQEKICSVEPSEDNFRKLARIMINRGDLESAVKIYTSLNEKYPKLEYLDKLHDLYAWRSDLENMQMISLKKLDYEIPQKDLRSGLSESRALADMESMLKFYDRLYENKGLVSDEYKDFVDCSEKFYGTEETLSRVEKLLEKHPRNAQLLSDNLRLYSYNCDYENTILAFESLIKVRKPEIFEAKIASNAYVMTGRETEALKAMIMPDDWVNADDEYLDITASLAWCCSDRKLSAKVQNTLLDRESSVVNTYYLVNSIEKVNSDNASRLLDLYRTKKDEVLLYELLNYGLSCDPKFLDTVFETISSEPVYGSNGVLSYRAARAISLKKYKEAKSLYEQMIKNDPKSVEGIDGLCNLALLTNRTDEARSLYKKYRLAFARNPSSYLVAANLAQAIGYNKESLMWYRKYLEGNSNPDLMTILAIATLYEEQGEVDRAYKIRKYAVSKKTDDLLKLEDQNVTLSSLVATFIGIEKSQHLMKTTLKDSDNVSVPLQYYLSVLLSQNRVLESVTLKNSRNAVNLELPDYQELLIAIKTNDRQKIEHLLEKGSGIEKPLIYDGLKKLNRTYDAYDLAIKNIGKTGKASDAALRSLAASDRAAMHRSVKGTYTAIPKWGVRSEELSYHAPYAYGEYLIASMYQSSDAPDALDRSSIADEKRLKGEISYSANEKYTFIAKADFADGAGDNRNGILTRFEFKFDPRFEFALEGALNQHSTLSHMMSVLGKDSYAGATVS
ncbi:MAG: tetratricopeptide repeat protein, partial [Succinivibrio sp.]